MYAAVCEHVGGDMSTPWKDLPKKTRDALLYGLGDETIRIDYVTRDGTNTRRYFKVEAFGRPLKEDAQTAEAVEYILTLQRSEETINGYFLAPTTPVVVTDVRVYNYSEEWTRSSYEHGFESYMADELDAFYSDTWNDSHL